MRLTPAIAHAFDRIVPKGGDVICDTHLPGGTIVGISAVVVHQDKEIYGQDAHLYRPERWLEASEEQLKLMEKTFFTVSALADLTLEIKEERMGGFT